mmetsp:Transcript_32525/g.31000  ORF Transcript_32525/g.31000 Transcript_32525/m.31000 type:complete len:366 (-) Transcript_32525:187-1284(-)
MMTIRDNKFKSLFIICVLIRLTNCDNLYLDGFGNPMGLPGGPKDPRGIETLPFSIDTNRLSDGVSSTDPHSNDSPVFPVYDGSVVLSTDRYQLYVDYMANAALQGIAGYGAGDAEKEDAKVLIISQAGYTQFPAPVKNFNVDAKLKWNPSGFAIQEGEHYTISVNASQLWMDGLIEVNANGYDSFFDAVSGCFMALGSCRSYLKKKKRFDSNWMSLICGIGQFIRPLGPIQKGNESMTYFLPLDESFVQSTLFDVGLFVEFLAPYTGELICFANDAQNLYWNNNGQLNVTATRISWPPSNTTYYQALYLPACDSATAVYANGNTNGENATLKCNPNGGGSGWTEAATSNQTVYRYASSAPENLPY